MHIYWINLAKEKFGNARVTAGESSVGYTFRVTVDSKIVMAVEGPNKAIVERGAEAMLKAIND